jgi:hypothetical protein
MTVDAVESVLDERPAGVNPEYTATHEVSRSGRAKKLEGAKTYE